MNDEQSDKLSSIMSKIEETSANKLNKICKADGCLVGDSVHGVGELDQNNFKERLFKDQQSNSMCTGSKFTMMLRTYCFREMLHQSLEYSYNLSVHKKENEDHVPHYHKYHDEGHMYFPCVELL